MPKTAFPNAKAALARALDLLGQARDLIPEATDSHIYDHANGEQPGPDCPYTGMVRDIDAFLAGCPPALRDQGRFVKDSPGRAAHGGPRRRRPPASGHGGVTP